MSKQLKEYNEKRDFEKTTEPEGREEDSDDELKFVVQHHIASNDHYDFRLEWNGALLSWAVPKGPSYNTSDKRLAVHVEDHPLEYRNFEGNIPKGEYGGGVVMLWDEGSWQPLLNVEDGLRDGMLKFDLKGKRLRGKWALVRLKRKDGDSKDNWLLLKEKDQYANMVEEMLQYNTSIRTGRTMSEIESHTAEKIIKNPFDKADVQLAKLAKQIPEGEDWLYELKYDGYRILAFVEGNNVRLITRNGNDYTKYFYDIATSLILWVRGRTLVLDGEIVVTDELGKTDFQALQNYIKNGKTQNLVYIIFDLLALDGVDLRSHILIHRKEMLEKLMLDAPSNLYYSRYVKGRGKVSFDAACATDMEGIVGKRPDSIYSGTRNGDWIKLKCTKIQEFVIGGYTISDKRDRGVSSLLLGIYEGEDLIYVGRAGTGISGMDMKMLEEKFKKQTKIEAPFKSIPSPRPNERVIWLNPELIAKISFAEWTKDNLLRHASYKGLSTGKNPKDIKREYVESKDIAQSTAKDSETGNRSDADKTTINGVKITNPNKVIFNDPKTTKLDVVNYYSMVAERMLPFISGRILSIVRCPKGVSEACFYKKHPGPGSKAIVTIPIFTSDGEVEDYFYIEDTKGLISEAQMGTIEFHTWGSNIDQLENPDVMVFDLDPDEGMDIDRVRQGVEDVKSILDELSLKSYLKTSGGKGYHILIPLKPSVNWDIFYNFSRQVAELMERKWPDRYTSNIRKASRKDRIFIDWIRNGRGATSIAPYSLRSRKGIKVSMPIDWSELYSVAPDSINMKETILRLQNTDPWKDFFNIDQMLK